jgi:hypothetical protein
MATYYVTQNGSGLQNGQTVADSWSVANFSTFGNWSSPAVVAGKISPGDTVYFLGTITGNPVTQQDGTITNHITLRGDYPGIPGVFDGDNVRNKGLKIGTNYLNITNLTFQNYINDGVLISALYAEAGHYNVNITNCTFTNTYDSQGVLQTHIYLTGSARDTHDISVTNNTFNGPGWAFRIRQGNADTYNVYNITFSNNIVGNSTTWFPVWGAVQAQGPTPPLNQYLVGGGFLIESTISSGTATIHDIIASNNLISNTYNHGIQITSSSYSYFNGYGPYNLTITGNTINNTGVYPIAISCRNYGSGSLVANNIIDGGGVLKVINSNGIQLLGAAGLVVENNIVSRQYTATPTGDAAGIILDHGLDGTDDVSDGVIVRYNYIFDCNNANTVDTPAAGIDVYRGSNSQIYGNVIIGAGIGVKVTAPFSNANKIYNNTIINCITGYYEYNYPSGNATTGQTLKNNIIANNSSYGILLAFISGAGTIIAPTEDHNLFYANTSGNYIDNRTGSNSPVALNATDITANPSFISASNYHLLPYSPAANAGAVIAGIHDQATLAADIDGVSVHFKPSIGAYEVPGPLAVTANYSPTGYELRGTTEAPAELRISGNDIVVDMTGLTADEYVRIQVRGSAVIKNKGSNQKIISHPRGGTRGMGLGL